MKIDETAIGRRITDEENKAIQLSILKYFSDFCEKNHLRYFLGDGTLLGAIRHNGYIPWDDDIDVRMPRPDYERLIMVFNDQKSNYKLINPRDKISRHFYVKIIDTRTIKIERRVKYHGEYLGVDIDVFPIDGAPDDICEFEKMSAQLRSYNKAFAYKKKGFIMSVLGRGKDVLSRRYPARFIPFKSCNDILDITDNIIHRYPYDGSNYRCAVGIMDHFRFPAILCEDAIEHQFEDGLFKIPSCYDELLRIQYGDYMELPPVSEQEPHHFYKIYWRNNLCNGDQL